MEATRASMTMWSGSRTSLQVAKSCSTCMRVCCMSGSALMTIAWICSSCLAKLKVISAKHPLVVDRMAALAEFLGLSRALDQALQPTDPGASGSTRTHVEHQAATDAADSDDESESRDLLLVLRHLYFHKRKLPDRLKEAFKYLSVAAQAEDNADPGDGACLWMQLVICLLQQGRVGTALGYLEKANHPSQSDMQSV
eukprot:GDKI01011054.1.p1 GENE.GDKI01011054.1~~GDKI01011054.1.p1  ORF type:complete len:197 (-),score=29.39 GDKI01011054.1:135-725(-)